LSGNNLGQVVHTNVPLFTKQYNLVPCEGFHVNAPVCGSHYFMYTDTPLQVSVYMTVI